MKYRAFVYQLVLWAALTASILSAAPLPKTVTSASEVSYPPFCVVDANGQASGFSVELMREALNVMGCEVTFQTGAWHHVRTLLEDGRVDALPLVARTPEREALFDFTFPYMPLHGAIVIRRDRTDITGPEDLRQRSVAVMQDDSAHEYMQRAHPEAQLTLTGTFKEALQMLSHGQCDAVVIQRLLALRLIEEAGLKNLHLLPQPLEGFRQDFCFAVQEGDQETLALLNEGLAVVMANGTFRRLRSKWFGTLLLPINRRIIVAGDHNYPPYEFLNEKGLPDGYNVELTRRIARTVGLDIEFRLGPWHEIRQAVARGEADVLQGAFYSAERDEDFDFSQPHAVNHCVAVVRQGDSQPASTEDLHGLNLVVQRADIMHDFVIQHNLTNRLTLVETPEEALQQLHNGQHDAALVSRLIAEYLIEKNEWRHLTVGKKTLHAVEYCYATPEGHQSLLAQFDEGLQLVINSGQHREIYKKWFGTYPHQHSLAEWVKRAALFILPLLALLLLALLWSWSLRRQVAAQTRELQYQTDLLRETGRIAKVGGWKFNPVTKVGAWTEETARIHGQDPDAKLNMQLGLSFYRGDSKQKLEQALQRAMDESLPYDLELEIDSADGKHKWVRTIGHPVTDHGQVKEILGAVQDITDRKQAEEKIQGIEKQLLQAQRLEAVGRLAGGVAHDYNNMLSIIIGYVDLAKTRLDPEEKALLDDLTEIRKAAMRSADITRQLLAFARKQTVQPHTLNLNQTIENMLKMLQRLIGEDLDLSWNPGESLWSVRMDPSQIDQILANLCVNARDAISGVGKITIETANTTVDENYSADHLDARAGEYVMLAVSDDGCGMDPDTQRQIFEPFFTTKGKHKGTGLGLSTVYGIVRQNNGFINLYSEPGKGTTFKIYIPRHHGEMETKPETVAVQEPLGRGETVLVVEDDPGIVKLTGQMLKKLNYQAMTATSTEQAIELAQAHRETIDLLLTDVVMPEMNGRDLAETIKPYQPHMKLLYMSGYTANVIAHRGVLDEGIHFLAKPFTRRQLAQQLYEILHGDD